MSRERVSDRLDPISTCSRHRFRADNDMATAIFGHLTGAVPHEFEARQNLEA
jgi:hypothetical protein